MSARRIRAVFRDTWVRIGAMETHPRAPIPVPLRALTRQAFMRDWRRFAKDDGAHEFSCSVGASTTCNSCFSPKSMHAPFIPCSPRKSHKPRTASGVAPLHTKRYFLPGFNSITVLTAFNGSSCHSLMMISPVSVQTIVQGSTKRAAQHVYPRLPPALHVRQPIDSSRGLVPCTSPAQHRQGLYIVSR